MKVYGLRSDITWQQIGQDIDGEAAFDNFGSSVSISSLGDTVAAGAILNDGVGDKAGHARIYKLCGYVSLGIKCCT